MYSHHSAEHLPEGGRASFKNPKPYDVKHSGGKEVNILLLGIRGVGKTALVVRYLTKRFIGDYDSELEVLYSHTISLDGKHVTLHVLDTVGQVDKGKIKEDQILWADGIFFVYSITNKQSFDVIKELLESVTEIKADDKILIGVVANKSDLLHQKEVSDTEVSQLCAEYNCMFFETSASESLTSVTNAFTSFSKQIRQVQKKREKLTRFMQNPAVAAKLQIQQSLRNLAERTWRSRTSTL